MTDYSGYTPYDETVTFTGGGWGDIVNQAANAVNQNPALRATVQQYAPIVEGVTSNALNIAKSTPMGMVAETGFNTAKGIYNDPAVKRALAPALQQLQQTSYGQQAQRALGQAQQAYGQAQQAYGQAQQAYGQVQQPQQAQQFAMGGGLLDYFRSKPKEPQPMSMSDLAYKLSTQKMNMDDVMQYVNSGNAQSLYREIMNGLSANVEAYNGEIFEKIKHLAGESTATGGKKRVRKLQPAPSGGDWAHRIRFPVRPLEPGESAWNEQAEQDSKNGGKKSVKKSALQEVNELYGGCGTCGMDGGKKQKSGGRPRAKSKKSARPKSKKRKARK